MNLFKISIRYVRSDLSRSNLKRLQLVEILSIKMDETQAFEKGSTNVIRFNVWSSFVQLDRSIDLWYYGRYREVQIFDTTSNVLILEGPLQVFVRSSIRCVLGKLGWKGSEKLETEGNYTSRGVKTWNFLTFLTQFSTRYWFKKHREVLDFSPSLSLFPSSLSFINLHFRIVVAQVWDFEKKEAKTSWFF